MGKECGRQSTKCSVGREEETCLKVARERRLENNLLLALIYEIYGFYFTAKT